MFDRQLVIHHLTQVTQCFVQVCVETSVWNKIRDTQSRTIRTNRTEKNSTDRDRLHTQTYITHTTTTTTDRKRDLTQVTQRGRKFERKRKEFDRACERMFWILVFIDHSKPLPYILSSLSSLIVPWTSMELFKSTQVSLQWKKVLWIIKMFFRPTKKRFFKEQRFFASSNTAW